jgi:hypothetical protein
MNNVVIDRYTLELEALSEHENSPTPYAALQRTRTTRPLLKHG